MRFYAETEKEEEALLEKSAKYRKANRRAFNDCLQ